MWRWTQIVEVTLIVAVLLLHGVLLWGRHGWLAETFGFWGQVLSDAVPAAQLSLLVLWATLGPGATWLRLAYTLPLLVVAGLGAWTGWDYGAETISRWILVGSAGLVGVLGIGLTLAGWRLRDARQAELVRGTQFSIRSLFIITTLIALLIGGLEAARPWLAPQTDWQSYPPVLVLPLASWPRLALVQGLIAALSMTLLWALLRPGAIWLRLGAVAVVAGLAGLYEAHLTAADNDFVLAHTAWNIVFVLLLAGSLVPIRWLGWRWYRPVAVVVKPVPGSPVGTSPFAPVKQPILESIS